MGCDQGANIMQDGTVNLQHRTGVNKTLPMHQSTIPSKRAFEDPHIYNCILYSAELHLFHKLFSSAG
jgi:hypothetical protein